MKYVFYVPIWNNLKDVLVMKAKYTEILEYMFFKNRFLYCLNFYHVYELPLEKNRFSLTVKYKRREQMLKIPFSNRNRNQQHQYQLLFICI